MTPPANLANYPVRRLEKSVMSDHIGISTLAVTTDGYVIILHQNDKALTSTDRLTPSGSGSVDFSDLRPDSDFRETLKAAAERELREETNLPAGRIGHTEVIGFYRDLGRGGKPEFCCLTRLNASSFEIAELEPSCEEQRDDFETYQILGETGELDGKDFGRFSDMALNLLARMRRRAPLIGALHVLHHALPLFRQGNPRTQLKHSSMAGTGEKPPADLVTHTNQPQ